MRASRHALAERLRALLRLDDPPWRIALALAVGVFISVTPFWGVQTLLALLVATLFRLNKAATVTGAWLNLPWFAPFIYAGALRLGALFVPGAEGFKGFWVALLVGTTLLGIGAAALTWLVAFAIIARRRARHAGRPAADVSDQHAA